MPMLTLNQAAREAGKAKKTILEAIRAGRLSAPKDGQGRYQIDPAELFRVWSPTPTEPVSETETHPLPPGTETALLRQRAELLERENRRMEQAVEDLREDRDQWRRQATNLLLTHQTEGRNPEAKTTALRWVVLAVVVAVLISSATLAYWLVFRQTATSIPPPPFPPHQSDPAPTKPPALGEPWKPDDGG